METKIKPMFSIYHQPGNGPRTIRLNLLACKELMNRHLDDFDDLSESDHVELQRRLLIYCEFGKLDVNSGDTKYLHTEHEQREPSIDQLPDKQALALMHEQIENEK
jgi:hypothetical protein